MINVGIITENHFPMLGGMEIAVHELIKNINVLDEVSASVACSTMPHIPLDFIYPYPCYRSKSFSVLTPYLTRLNQIKMINEQKTNILHGPMLHGGGFAASRLKRKLGIPLVSHSRGSDVQVVPEIGYGALLNKHNLDKIRTTIRWSDKIIAVSSINKKNIVDLGAHPDNVIVIPNGIPIDQINATPVEDFRGRYNLLEDDFVIITVGRNRPIKRMELLFEALKLLKEYKKIKCLCIGPKENLAALAKIFDVQEKVVLAGEIPSGFGQKTKLPHAELINAYKSANLYVSTSYLESFGNSAAEALASGIPIIIGQKHGIQDIILENRTGWIMPKETPQSLAELLLDRYDDKEDMIRMKDEIKKSVSHLTWQNIASETVDLYKSIL